MKLENNIITDTLISLKAGTASAGTASMKIAAGTLLSTPEIGAVESDGTDYYWTDSSGNRIKLSNYDLLKITTGINAKTVANTSLYTVPAGKSLVVQCFNVRVSAASAITVGPSGGVGNVAGTNNIAASQNMTALTTTANTFQWPIVGASLLTAAAGQIYFNLGIASTGTSQTIIIDLIGYLV